MSGKQGDEPIFGCARCDNRWSGTRTCHCPSCHQNFTVERAFVKHLDHRRSGTEMCRPAEEVGLVDAGRKYQCWGTPYDGVPFWEDKDS